MRTFRLRILAAERTFYDGLAKAKKMESGEV